MYDVKIQNSHQTDHSSVNLLLQFNALTTGKALWKFYNFLLYDVVPVKSISGCDGGCKREKVIQMFDWQHLDGEYSTDNWCTDGRGLCSISFKGISWVGIEH